MKRQRVVVTGMGVVTPIGGSVREFGDALLAGASGVGPITVFDPASLPTRIAAEVRRDGIEYRDRKVAFAMWAAEEAMADIALSGSEGGLSLGIGLELFSLEDAVAARRADAGLPNDLRERLTFLQTPSDICVHLLSHRFKLGQPPHTHVSACAAGTDAIGLAFELVASGRRRWMLAGGTDSMINPLGVGGFCKLGALSQRNDEPHRASRPFDRDRDGFVLGEGAGLLLLESEDDAIERAATIHAEIAGYGCSFDAHGISEPHPEGRGALQAMRRAIKSAGIAPEEIDCINAHGTSTPKNDPVETLAIRHLLGSRADSVPVCATKSMIGHLVAAAGAVEAIAAIACMNLGWVHPTINLDHPDPACDLDYVPNTPRRLDHRCVLSNSFAFGGQNAALVIRMYDSR